MAFLGIKVPHDVGRLISGLEVAGEKTSISDYHITVIFLEDHYPIAEVAKALEAIYDVVSDIKPFLVSSKKVSSFPSKGSIPVVAKIESEELHDLRKKLVKEFKKRDIKFTDNFPSYKPHITLSYCEKEIKDFKIDPIEFVVNEIVLWAGDNSDDKLSVIFPLKSPEKRSKHSGVVKEFWKFASILSPSELMQKFNNLETITEDNAEDVVDNLGNQIIDICKHLDIMVRELHQLSKNAQLIKQNNDKINLLLGKIQEYANLDFKDLFNILKRLKITLSKTKYIEISDTIYSLTKDIKRYAEFIDNFQNKIQGTQYQHYYGGQMYIRFGKYPKSERSTIGLDDEWIKEMHGKRLEDGVSVYKALPVRGKWLLREPNQDKAMYASKFDIGFLAERIAANEIYLVTGEELNRTGVDGEPLIVNVFPIKKLQPSDIILGSSDKDSPTLEQWMAQYYKSHHQLAPYAMTNIEKRNIALWMSLMLDALESEKETAAMKISEPQYNELVDFYDKSKYGKSLDNLTEEELSKLQDYIKIYQKYRNKKQVMRGYRPLY